MKKELMQLLSDFSVQCPTANTYEQRIIQDSSFDDVADAIIELINKQTIKTD